MEDEKWVTGKYRHKELSNRAADEYDDLYAASNFATESYMKYELDLIDTAISHLERSRRRIAIDLGCGTGRDAFHYYRHFAHVTAYDFAEDMIKKAQKKKLAKSAGNIQFVLRDLEEDLLTDLPNSSVAFASSGFGMGSFVRELSPLLREIKRVLEPGGVFVISFYNQESLVVQLDTLEWSPSLAARFDSKSGYLKVNFKDEIFDVAVQPYSLRQVRDILRSYFEVIELSTFPTLSALFPNSIFDSKRARDLCTVVDRELRFSKDISGGPYIAAICQKAGRFEFEAEERGYLNIIRALEDHQIIPNVKEHAPVKSPDDVARELGADKSELVKSILISVVENDPEQNPKRNPRYFAVVLQSDRNMDYAKVARTLNVNRTQISIASANEVEELTGFRIGGIPPFGFPRRVNVLLDARIKVLERVYCGTGKKTESLRLSVPDLIRLSTPVIADLSKELNPAGEGID